MKRLIAAIALGSLAFSASALEIGKPFEQTELDRVLPNIAGRADTASTGGTQSAQSPWANDYNFIAPAL
ncbi:MAG TPA: hypothetical protein VH600_16010 [Burkholderiales bacterium]|jgi:hypothetical protein